MILTYVLAELGHALICQLKIKINKSSFEDALVGNSESSTRNAPINGTSVYVKHPNLVKGMSFEKPPKNVDETIKITIVPTAFKIGQR